MDNLFTLLKLLDELTRREIGLGTMCQNRLQNAQIQSKGSLNRQRGGTYDFSCDNKGNMIVSSYDTTVVTCATRYFRCLSENVSTTKRFWSKAEIKRIYLPITKAFEVYNKHMGGVDMLVQFIVAYRVKIRSKNANGHFC